MEKQPPKEWGLPREYTKRRYISVGTWGLKRTRQKPGRTEKKTGGLGTQMIKQLVERKQKNKRNP